MIEGARGSWLHVHPKMYHFFAVGTKYTNKGNKREGGREGGWFALTLKASGYQPSSQRSHGYRSLKELATLHLRQRVEK